MKVDQDTILRSKEVARLIEISLSEDLASAGDVTTNALVPPEREVEAMIIARRPCTVSGVSVAAAVFSALDSEIICSALVEDGSNASADQTIMTIRGRARPILAGERIALNFMQRMIGIATRTAFFSAIAGKYGVKVLDTRKTTPGMRILEKYAVLCGGGDNHRRGLYDMVLIKDNHRSLWKTEKSHSLADAVRQARRNSPGIPVEIEVENESELLDALAGKPDWILLDNMSPSQLRRCVELCGGKAGLEASGGITQETFESVAETGVDAISLGCLTHSVTAADLSLEMEHLR